MAKGAPASQACGQHRDFSHGGCRGGCSGPAHSPAMLAFTQSKSFGLIPLMGLTGALEIIGAFLLLDLISTTGT
jgi:hypothetical protein